MTPPRPSAVPWDAGEEGWLPGLSVLPNPWAEGEALRLRRAWPRTADHVLLEYAGEEAPERRVVGQWLADGDRLHAVGEAMRTAAGPDAAVLHAAPGVVLHRGGVDRRLPPLRRLLDDPAAALVVHRPERRAVVRIDPPATGGTRRWVKLVRPDHVAGLLERTAWLDPLGSAVPRLLDVRAREGMTVWADLPGVPLTELLDGPRSGDAMARTGALLRRLHDIAPPPGAAAHDAAAEVRVLQRWMDHLTAFFPALHRRVGPFLPRIAALLEDTAGAPLRRATIHRDLHDGQVLVAPTGVGLLDPDTVAEGEPELDLGNLRAHLLLHTIGDPGGALAADGALSAALDAYGRDGLDPRRLHAYTAAALLRLVAVHAFRPATRACLPQLIDEVARRLGREGLPPGVPGRGQPAGEASDSRVRRGSEATTRS